MLNLHPLIVHFPIALLISSVALDWAGRRWTGRGLDKAAWYTLLLGLAGLVFALISGFRAGSAVPADSPALATLGAHKILGIATFVVFGLQAVCAWRRHGAYSSTQRVLHTGVQVLGVALIVALGYLGGELVYTYGVGVAMQTP